MLSSWWPSQEGWWARLWPHLAWQPTPVRLRGAGRFSRAPPEGENHLSDDSGSTAPTAESKTASWLSSPPGVSSLLLPCDGQRSVAWRSLQRGRRWFRLRSTWVSRGACGVPSRSRPGVQPSEEPCWLPGFVWSPSQCGPRTEDVGQWGGCLSILYSRYSPPPALLSSSSNLQLELKIITWSAICPCLYLV